jgi:hypothetical protein
MIERNLLLQLERSVHAAAFWKYRCPRIIFPSSEGSRTFQTAAASGAAREFSEFLLEVGSGFVSLAP